MTDKPENPYASPNDLGYGMTLRDYYAGQALAGMAGMAAMSDEMEACDQAWFAYEVADAMLKERSKWILPIAQKGVSK